MPVRESEEDIVLRLRSVAYGVLASSGVTIGQVADSRLNALFREAAAVLEARPSEPDDDLDRTEAAVGLLLRTAVDLAIAAAGSSRPHPENPPLLERRFVEEALNSLCPGFWPFC